MLRTVDGGATWKASQGPTSTTLVTRRCSVEFKDAFTGWIHGYNDDELITRDGGVDLDEASTRSTRTVTGTGHRSRSRTFGTASGARAPPSGGGSTTRAASTSASTAVHVGTRPPQTRSRSTTSATSRSRAAPRAIWCRPREAGSGRRATRVVAGLCVRVTRLITTGASQSARARYQGAGRSRFRCGYRTRIGQSGSGVSHLSQRQQLVCDPPAGEGRRCMTSGPTTVSRSGRWARRAAIVRSLNGGDTWQREGRDSARAVRTSKRSRCYRTVVGFAAGTNKVLRTTDNGSTWTTVTVPPAGRRHSVWMSSTRTHYGWAPAMDGCFEATTPVCHGWEVSASARSGV